MWRVLYILILTIVVSGFAEAQNRPGPPGSKPDGWSFYVGGGMLYAPSYLGDNDYQLSAVPYIRVTKGDRFFASVQEGVGYSLINNENFRAGPLAQLEFGRDENGSSPFRISGERTKDLIGLGDIDTSVSIGGFAEYDFGNFELKVTAGHALGGHDGAKAEISFEYDKRVMTGGPPLFITLGPNVVWADNKFLDANFGVSAAQALASGLAENNPSSGIYSYGASGNILLPVSRKGNAALVLIGSYDRLTGDAADAPLVTGRGSRDQFFTGLAFARKF